MFLWMANDDQKTKLHDIYVSVTLLCQEKRLSYFHECILPLQYLIIHEVLMSQQFESINSLFTFMEMQNIMKTLQIIN